MFAARFHDLASQTLRDFNGFGNGTSFGDKSQDIWTRTQIAALLQILHAHSDGYFFNFGQMFLTFHENSPSIIELHSL